MLRGAAAPGLERRQRGARAPSRRPTAPPRPRHQRHRRRGHLLRPRRRRGAGARRGTAVFAVTALLLVPVALAFASWAAASTRTAGRWRSARDAFGRPARVRGGLDRLRDRDRQLGGGHRRADRGRGPPIGRRGGERPVQRAAATAAGARVLALICAAGLRMSARNVDRVLTVLKLAPLVAPGASCILVGGRASTAAPRGRWRPACRAVTGLLAVGRARSADLRLPGLRDRARAEPGGSRRAGGGRSPSPSVGSLAAGRAARTSALAGGVRCRDRRTCAASRAPLVDAVLDRVRRSQGLAALVRAARRACSVAGDRLRA